MRFFPKTENLPNYYLKKLEFLYGKNFYNKVVEHPYWKSMRRSFPNDNAFAKQILIWIKGMNSFPKEIKWNLLMLKYKSV